MFNAASPDSIAISAADAGAPIAPLLHWYRQSHRQLPWRSPPKQTSDPYKVWLSEIMLQQTTVRAVIPYFLNFITRWPTVSDLASAPLDDVLAAWAGLGYYARARNLHACANVVANQLNGHFPDTLEGLQNLPGIGPYTAGAILTIAFQKSAPVMDGNIERVISRLNAIAEPLPTAKPLYRAYVADLFAAEQEAPGDLAQALMDLGATICTPAKPACGICPVSSCCTARARNEQEHYPVKAAKAAVPSKHGQVYWITNDQGQVLTEKRPAKGMLGSMRGLLTSAWVPVGETLPVDAGIAARLDLQDTTHEIRHVFTHFSLTLRILTGSTNSLELPANMMWLAPDQAWMDSLPTLFRKAAKLMRNTKP